MPPCPTGLADRLSGSVSTHTAADVGSRRVPAHTPHGRERTGRSLPVVRQDVRHGDISRRSSIIQCPIFRPRATLPDLPGCWQPLGKRVPVMSLAARPPPRGRLPGRESASRACRAFLRGRLSLTTPAAALVFAGRATRHRTDVGIVLLFCLPDVAARPVTFGACRGPRESRIPGHRHHPSRLRVPDPARVRLVARGFSTTAARPVSGSPQAAARRRRRSPGATRNDEWADLDAMAAGPLVAPLAYPATRIRLLGNPPASHRPA